MLLSCLFSGVSAAKISVLVWLNQPFEILN